MKKTNYAKSLLLLAFLLLGTLVANAQDFDVDGISYEINPDGSTVSVTGGFPEYAGDVNIPGTVSQDGSTYSVTAIGSYAFSDCTELTGVTIPKSVTSVGKSVFKRCSNLTEISVEDGNAKYDSRDGCNAIIETATNTLIAGCKNTVIPNSVTAIAEDAFDENTTVTRK